MRDRKGMTHMSDIESVTGKAVPESLRERATQGFEAWLDRQAVLSENNSGAFMGEQVANILLADDTDEMWSADDIGDTASSREMPDVEMSVQSFTVHRGQLEYSESTFPYFMIVQAARLDTGEEFVFSTGAPLIMAKIKWLDDHEELPAECVIKAATTRKGYTVLKLYKISERAVRVTS